MTALDIWEPEITDEIRALAKTRILDGSNLRTADLPRRTIKLALVLVRILNPAEELSNAELSILMGIGKNHLTEILVDKHFLETLNR
jgi:hypothetical protein